MLSEMEESDIGNPQVRLCEIVRSGGSCGFNLTKSKWDPYPWVSTVDSDSPAQRAGVQAGDCLLEVNGEDVLGLRVLEVANRMRQREDRVTVMLWSAGVDPKCTPEALCCGPMPTNLQRLSSCMSNILSALECPICLDTISPPTHQCANGHLICLNCRVRTERCPICRMKFFRGRSLLADQVFDSLITAFDLREEEESKRAKLLRRKLCGDSKKRPEIKLNFLSTPKNKFLTRIMGLGKSSSVENLSESKMASTTSTLFIPTEGLKAKSLSSSEIFRTETLSRANSHTSVLSNRPGSGLFDLQRPASYHDPSEDLHNRLFADFGIELKAREEQSCCCPCDASCEVDLTPSKVMRHVQDHHAGPLVYYFKPSLELALPLNIPNSSLLVLACLDSVFILKMLDYRWQTAGSVWVWQVGQGQRVTVTVSLERGEHSVCCQSEVQSLSTQSWQYLNIVHFDCETARGILEPGGATLRVELTRNR